MHHGVGQDQAGSRKRTPNFSRILAINVAPRASTALASVPCTAFHAVQMWHYLRPVSSTAYHQTQLFQAAVW